MSAGAGAHAGPEARAIGGRAVSDVLGRCSAAVMLAITGYVHAQLYITGYRYIHVIGVLFLIQASVSFALALLLVVGGPTLLRLAALAVTLGALGGFLASRTVGIFGFSERGLQPAPQALISLLAEIAAVGLLALPLARSAIELRRSR